MAIRLTLKDDLLGEELKSKLNSFGLELIYNDQNAELLTSEEEKKIDKKSSKNNFNKNKNDNIK
ncbi:MAG: hypothetical protein PHN86_10715 [Proteiniphilum sp.]|nr:hypothetical protein [Proteiniphilum sp.]